MNFEVLLMILKSMFRALYFSWQTFM